MWKESISVVNTVVVTLYKLHPWPYIWSCCMQGEHRTVEGCSTIHDILWIVIRLLSIHTDVLFLGQLEGGCIGSSQEFKANNGSPIALEHLMVVTSMYECAPKSLITYYRSSHGF